MPSKKETEKDTGVQEVLERLSLLENKLEILDSQNSELQNLLRILAHPILSSSLQGIFKTSKQLYAYELSNGERSTRDIGRLVNSDQKSISNWWREWETKGLVEKVGKKGQFKARYSLLELLVVYSPGNDKKSSKEQKNG
jgi:predicted transcriptional regulator